MAQFAPNLFMKKTYLLLLVMSLTFSITHTQPLLPYGAKAGEDLTVYVHPGVELMAVVQLLAGKYPAPAPSAYEEDMKTWFKPYEKHPAVDYIRSFKKNLYTDFIELGWCFDDFPRIRLTDPTTKNWFRHYGKDSVLQYLQLVKQFYHDSRFWAFYSSHEPQYAVWAADVQQKIRDSASFEKLYGFYRMSRPVKLYIGIEPLNNWGAHAIPSLAEINPLYTGVVAYETGYFNDTATRYGQPKFTMGTETIYDLLWHEGSHIILSELLKKFSKEIESMAGLYNKNDEGMRRNQISNWPYCAEENIVRSVVACLKGQYRGYRTYEKTISREDAADFIYVNDIAPLIRKEYMQGKTYRDFSEFFPVLLKHLSQLVNEK